MTEFGSLIWIIAIGALVYFMVKKGGGCCGSQTHGHDHERDKEKPRGGCCG